ncbi:MAG: 16S rRNA (guanine(966)-N(2))-methyltransferase RsmD [Dehalococcoidales bacterium]|nr:16S rRNA (guanine(966)-N(2))-methyltransferase RsmD [Dehalococcoidales bacterium]MDD3264743.1 16S rRNA (guanine(966)-N(2))-methyltransferase RsmD [Dehalococcoidales bacterium]MDD4794332.1 16S rRNA (guanine(966)-N(2))-methyltransferase RsmD [Dehalococcoidales bacterium]
MRIISGIAKGRPIKMPKRTPTRPATELVRGAIFSSLANMDASSELVLDLFSGSGSLGLEALSRGAGWVDFVDRDKRCCAIIKENLASMDFAQQARVYCLNVQRAIDLVNKEYNLILMDPPYPSTEIDSILQQLANSSLVGCGTVLCTTHSSRRPLKQAYSSMKMFKELRHGDSTAAFFMLEN